LLGQISHVANSTIDPEGDTFQETGWSYPRRSVPDLADEVFPQTTASGVNQSPCGVGDAATGVERVASAARGRSHTLNVYTQGVGISQIAAIDKPRTGTIESWHPGTVQPSLRDGTGFAFPRVPSDESLGYFR
jgi:hypothetical protein